MPETNSQQLTQRLLQQWSNDPANLLQILIELQFQLRHIPSQCINQLSEALSITPAQIQAVISFYSFLHSVQDAEYVVLFSDNITDRMLGSRQRAQELADLLGYDIGKISIDGKARIDFTSCIGMSDQGPAALINGFTVPHITARLVAQMAEKIQQQVPVNEWPASWFEVDLNVKRKDRLLRSDLTAGSAIHQAVQQGRERVLNNLVDAGLRGCGGAGFQTAIKWRICAASPAQQRVVVCNADEGEPGTFKDRLLLQQYADELFEGMTVCAATIGAQQGFVYLRGEYRYLLPALEDTLKKRREQKLLGQNILGYEGLDFDIHIHLGAGAYICGEESALIESLEGKRGIPRNRPPFPVTSGYLERPTVVNNVETLVLAAMITAEGAHWFNRQGTQKSPGTKLLSISGDCDHPGIYEYPFGVSVKQVLKDCGAHRTQAVQVGGPSGQLIPASDFSRSLSFEDLPTGGSFMIFDKSRDLLDVIYNFSAFFQHESCGFCTPCRVGSSLMMKQLDKIMVGHATNKDLDYIRTIGSLMKESSHCGLGTTAANPLLDSIKRFPFVYKPKLRSTRFEPSFDVNASLQEARIITGRDDEDAHLTGGGV